LIKLRQIWTVIMYFTRPVYVMHCLVIVTEDNTV